MDIPELLPAEQITADVCGNNSQEIKEDEDPKSHHEYSFDFKYVDARGHAWIGKFKNKILTIFEKQKVKVIKAQMSGGISVAALDGDIWQLNEMIAHMAVSLVEKPKWADNLTSLYDETIIDELYKEVASHEARFHRREPIDSAGAEST
jgi:hypothetical protein